MTTEQQPAFDEFVTKMVSGGLIARQVLVGADKPKRKGTGETVVEHPAGSPMGRAIGALDRREWAAEVRSGR